MLVEPDDENVMENTKVLGDGVIEGDNAIVSKVGIKFKDKNELFEFYKRYAYELGFSVKKRNLKNDEDGVVLRYVTLFCSH